MRTMRLHTKFIVLLISVSLLPLVIVSGVTLIQYQRTLQTDATALGSQLAETAAAEIRTFIVSQFGTLENVASIYNPDFPIKGDISDRITELTLLRSDNFYDLSVVDSSGHEIARKNRVATFTIGDYRDRSASDAFITVRDKGIYVGPVYVEGGRPFFDLARSIVDVRGKFSGAVIGQVDARVMPSVVAAISKIVQAPGRVYIVDNRGIVIAHPDISYVLSQRDLSALPPVHAIVSSPEISETTATYKNENGDMVLGSAHSMSIQLFGARSSTASSTINWYVIAEQPVSAVYSGAEAAAWFSLILSLIAVVLAVLAAIFFAGRISKPIEMLHRATIEFGKGNLAYRARVDSGDEIGDLARSFNVTADTLAETVDSLKSAKSQTIAERNKLSLVLESITNAVIAVDNSGKVILFNRAAELLTGYSTPEVLGESLDRFINLRAGGETVDIADYYDAKPDGSKYKQFDSKNLQLLRKDGGERFVTLAADRILDGTGADLGRVLTFQDITRELILERTKREFVSIAAHQLRTPLTGLSWTFETLLAGTLKPEQKEVAQNGLGAMHRMIELVNNLLNVSQIEEGRFGVKTVRQSIEPILKRILDNAQRQADKHGIILSTQIADTLPLLDVDALLIEFVFNNLIDNALKYTKEGGSIALRVRPAGSSLVVEVQDTGVGIPPEEYDRVFQKFYRSKNARALFTDGSGLGLYVARNIVEQHHGTISFTSKENEGTTFTVSLPLPA